MFRTLQNNSAVQEQITKLSASVDEIAERSQTELTGDITSVGNVTTAGPDIVKRSATQTLTNKTLMDTSNIVAAKLLMGNDNSWVVSILGAPPAPGQILTVDGVGTNASFEDPASLTGMVTTSGSVATVVTNANLTGDITSVGNATTAGPSIAKIASAQTLTNKTITGTTNSVDANSMRNGSTWVVPYGGAAPTNGQVLTYNGSAGAWVTPSTTVTMGGDVTAGSNASIVSKINGTAVAGASSANTANNLVLRGASGGISVGVLCEEAD